MKSKSTEAGAEQNSPLISLYMIDVQIGDALKIFADCSACVSLFLLHWLGKLMILIVGGFYYVKVNFDYGNYLT